MTNMNSASTRTEVQPNFSWIRRFTNALSASLTPTYEQVATNDIEQPSEEEQIRSAAATYSTQQQMGYPTDTIWLDGCAERGMPRSLAPERKSAWSGGLSKHLSRQATIGVVVGLVLLMSRVHFYTSPTPKFSFDETPFSISNLHNGMVGHTYNSGIPRIIHQTYESLGSTPHLKETQAQWHKVLPDFEYRFWTADECRQLIADHYPWFLKVYDAYPYDVQRDNVARFFIVLHFGGIYADIDIVPLRDLTSLLNAVPANKGNGLEVIAAETYNLGFTNRLFAAPANSTVLANFVHALPENAKPLFGLASLLPHIEVMMSTGSSRWWFFLESDQQHKNRVLPLNPAGWGQCHQCRRKCLLEPEAFFHGQKNPGESWQKWDTKFLNFFFCRPQLVIWLHLAMLAALWSLSKPEDKVGRITRMWEAVVFCTIFWALSVV